MKKGNKFAEWLSVLHAKKPGRIVLAIILIFNLVFLLISALIISSFSLTGTEDMGFGEAAFYTVTMILDAGCISYVVEDIGTSGVAISIICLGIVLIGMITFTGATIGYVTNWISGFIDNANAGTAALKLTNHIVILNWNSRASEIINDVLYCEGRHKIVVLVSEGKETIEKEISERISDTVERERLAVKLESQKLQGFKKLSFKLKNKFKPHVTVIVREGDVFSSKQLHDVSLDYAKSIIILGNDVNNSVCKYATNENTKDRKKGNALTIKTLMQVADITASDRSSDDQKIIVEIDDDWTSEIVNKIISRKARAGKCNIVPVRVNKVLGQILAQFSLMPELNLAYKELFSNRGAQFYPAQVTAEECADENSFNTSYLKHHPRAIPLTAMEINGQHYFYFSADLSEDIHKECPEIKTDFKVKLNRNYWIDKKYIVILGHNSKCHDIMESFSEFTKEWNYPDGSSILQIAVIDDEKSLADENYYSDYPFVTETISAGIYDRDAICAAIERLVDSHDGDTSVLILSDDSTTADSIDVAPLTNLVYIQDIINKKIADNPSFDIHSIDIIVEIIDPKHYDVVTSYSTNNVVISNRYISKMIMQIGDKDALFEFYNDILEYDTDQNSFDSKEIYAKKVSTFFEEIPAECTTCDLIRAVYTASIDPSIPKEKQNPTLVLGYVTADGKMTLFGGDQRNVRVKLSENDKIIVFTNH